MVLLDKRSLLLYLCVVINGLAMHRKSIAELLIKQRTFIAFIVYEPLLCGIINMKVIKEYQSRGMKHIQYDGSDADILKKRFTVLKHETVDKLCQWLIDNNTVIDADDCYDAQSGWQGTKFKIGKSDLSCNGYCLRNSNVELFLNGGQDPMWYNFWQHEYEEAEKWQKSNATYLECMKRCN